MMSRRPEEDESFLDGLPRLSGLSDLPRLSDLSAFASTFSAFASEEFSSVSPPVAGELADADLDFVELDIA